MKELQKEKVLLVFADAIKRLGPGTRSCNHSYGNTKQLEKCHWVPKLRAYYSEQQCICVYVCVCVHVCVHYIYYIYIICVHYTLHIYTCNIYM